MDDLKSELRSLHLEDIRTYIQSGNVVFQASGEISPSLADDVADGIEERHGFRPNVLVLSAKELEDAMNANPFPEAEAHPKTLHLFFLAAAPEDPDVEALNAAASPTERFQLDQRVFYLYAPDGIGRSKLAGNAERYLGVPATGRNWRTVEKLSEMVKA